MIVTDQPNRKSAPRTGHGKATLAIHGGAGGTLPPHIPPHLEQAYRAALRRSLQKGYHVLSNGGSALEAVCTSVQEMEDDPLFNAAKGAVFTSAGTNECEASVMSAIAPDRKELSQACLQRNRRCASAILVRNTRNPILLAKALYENARENPHVILSARTAEEIGWKLGCEKVDSRYYCTRRRWLEHRRALGLPDDDDPAVCPERGEGQEDEGERPPFEPGPGLNPFDPPPSYYANSHTDATPSLCASSHDSRASLDAKGTERSSSSEEAVTPSQRSANGDAGSEDGGDVGMQNFTHWEINFDAPRSHSNHARGTDEDAQSWHSSSFEELHHPPSAPLHRHQGSESLPAGTVGAVALDEKGNLAVATSTGGVTNKLPGRIGDTPTPGAGFWSEYWRLDATHLVKEVRVEKSSKPEERVTKERSCRPPCEWIRWVFGSRAQNEEQQDEEDAIEQASNRGSLGMDKAAMGARISSKEYRGVALSGTGTGDAFLRSSFASLLVHRMRFLGEGVDVAGSKAVAEMGELGGVGGAICIDDRGQVSFPMNSATMNRGYITQGGPPRVAIYANEECA